MCYQVGTLASSSLHVILEPDVQASLRKEEADLRKEEDNLRKEEAILRKEEDNLQKEEADLQKEEVTNLRKDKASDGVAMINRLL